MNVRILHTNDVHSRFENFARMSAKIRELKNENTIILDAGDFHDFLSVELQGTKGVAGGKFLKVADYDAIAVGNNEAFAEMEILETMTTTGLIPFLSCNFYGTDRSPINGIKRSVIVDRQGIRILIIGATPVCNKFYELEGKYASDPAEEVKKELESNKGNYDLCVLLSHLGIKTDREMAEKVEGIDVIVGGHTHTLMEAEVINNTIIHQSGQYGQYVGVLDIEFDGEKIKNYSSQNIDVSKGELDKRMIEEVSRQKEIAIDKLGQPLYEVDRDIWHDAVEENPITNLLADGLREVVPCDISIINSGIIISGIRRGDVSNKKLLEISPSPLNPTYIEIKGKYIKEALEASLNADVCLKDGMGPGFRGRFLGRLHVSGAKIQHDGKKVVKINLENGEFDENKIYRVATSDYLQRGTGYESLGKGKNEKFNNEYTRDTLREYLNKKEYVEKCFEDRWIKI